jgi:hypothetical protein
MKILIECNLDNAAFQDNQLELSEIIARQIPHNLEPGDDGKLKDSNGNTVGQWEVNESF